MSHEGYMRELGVSSQAAYPGFSDAPLDGFRHLAHDIGLFAQDFLFGDGSIIIRGAKAERGQLELENHASMARYVGDVRKREEARQRFQAEDWPGVVSLLDSLQYPEQMEKSDIHRLELAKRRTKTS